MTEATWNGEWNLGRLYTGPDDPRWEEDLGQALERARAFRQRFRGRIAVAGLGAQELGEALAELEALQKQGLLPCLYAQLLFAGDSRPDSHKALLARSRETASTIGEETLFFELELVRLPEEDFRHLLGSAEIAPFTHYLERVRAHAPYTLSEEVEQALKRKDLSGRDAFSQLFDELTSSLRYRLRFPGESEERELSGEELLALLYHPDRQLREAAFGTFLEKHADHALVLCTCFNNLLLDHGKEADLRGYPDLMTPTHLSSETEPEMVEGMLQVTEANVGLARDYFELKRQLLGLERMRNTDLYAPLPGKVRSFSFAEATDLVLGAFRGFSPRLAVLAEGFLAERRIDVYPRPGKSGGAFCMPMLPGSHPYLLLNFTGNLRDVSTLAHELGHGLHSTLAQGQNLFHYHAPLPMAETASVFAEMLLTRRLLDEERDPRLKIALLCAKLEEIIATTFRQTVLTRFEQRAHARRGSELLSADTLCDLWWEENARLFGDAVEMIPPYRWGWSYISHFIHARFYCYSYVFGELLVLALYRKYQEEGESFVPRFLDLLAAGGSRPPGELLAPLGIDLQDPGFWQKGYDVVGGLLGELKELLAQGDGMP